MNNVTLSHLNDDKSWPMVISREAEISDSATWAESNRENINELLTKHAALLFRGFDLNDAKGFEDFVRGIYPKLNTGYNDLPKVGKSKSIYKSTPYPENMKILFHNESSHMSNWPAKQWFYCAKPAMFGGATPIVDCRKVYNELPMAVTKEFEKKGLMYIRNFHKSWDIPWQTFYDTEDKSEVELICQRSNTDCIWLDNDILQTRKLAPAVIQHPDTKEKSFFNQIQLHHNNYLSEDIRKMLISMVGKEQLPRNVSFGDCSEIPPEYLSLIDAAYEKHAIRFKWKKNDVLMLDNMLFAHARDEFKGDRKIAVAMGDMKNVTDVN